MKLIIVLSLVCFYVSQLTAAPGGAPIEACETLLPQHNGTQPQNGTSPYRIEVGDPIIPGGRSYYVTISGISPSETLLGFIIQARPSNSSVYQTVGSFDRVAPTETSAQFLDCQSANDTATHTDRNPKSQVQVKWTAPALGNGTVIFRSTVVANFTTIWANLTSSVLQWG